MQYIITYVILSYCTVLHNTVLYYIDTMLCMILYCSVLHYSILFDAPLFHFKNAFLAAAPLADLSFLACVCKGVGVGR